MKNCDIHIRSIDSGEQGGAHLSCSIKLEEVDIFDKMMLMHTLALNLHMTKMDLIVYSKAEIDGVFDKDTTIITMPGGLNRES